MKFRSKLPVVVAIALANLSLAFSQEDPNRKPKEVPDKAENKPEANKANALPVAVKNSKEGKVFAAYDKDDNGFVSAEEMEAMMEGKQNSRGRREIRKAVNRADRNQDKQLNFEEFKFWYTVGRRDEKAENR